MSLKNSFCLLFLTVCAIHLGECQYDSDDFTDDDYYAPLLSKNKQNEKKENPAPATPPKDFFIPSLSFVPYSKIKTAAIRQIDDASKTAQPAPKKKKKKPCKHRSHGTSSQGEYTEDGEDYDDGHDDHGYHTDSGSRRRRSHGNHQSPVVRTHHMQNSRGYHNIPRVREVINKYTMEVMDN